MPRRIMLVDDDIAEISAVKRVLLRGGHQAVVATNASDALASIARELPDLVVLAPACENGDGAALARQLAREERTQGIPLILLGEGDLDGGAGRMLPRPVDPAALEDALRAALEPAAQVPPPLPHPVERRVAAADALRARAEELRTSSAPPLPDAAAIPDRVDPAAAGPRGLEQRGQGFALGAEPQPRLPALASPSDPAQGEGEAPRPAAAGWFDADVSGPDAVPQPLDAAAFERAGPHLRAGGERRLVAGSLEGERRRHEAEVALLAERTAAREEAAAQLRIAEEGARRDAAARSALEAEALRRRAEDEAKRRAELESEVARLAEAGRRAQEERQASQAAARRAAEEVEAQRAAVADAARRRVLALARERAAAAAARPSGGGAAEALAPEVAEGSLATVSMARLLALAARGSATGRLDVATEPPRSLWFEAGRIVGARSTAPGERTEEVALRLGLITREQHRQVSPAAAGLASRRVGVLLLEHGFLKPIELALLARRRAEEIAFALFASEAPYRLEPGDRVPADERLALDRGTLALAVKGVRRRWGPPRLDAVLGSAGTLLAPAARAPPMTDLALSGEERRVSELADGLRTLDEIVADAPLDPVSSRQVLAALVEVGALCVKILAPIGEPAPPPGSIDLARIDEKLDQVRRADYFVILGLERVCTPYEIKEAAERLLSELAPDRFEAVMADGLAAKLEEIHQVVEEARDILSDDVLRAEYLTGLGE